MVGRLISVAAVQGHNGRIQTLFGSAQPSQGQMVTGEDARFVRLVRVARASQVPAPRRPEVKNGEQLLPRLCGRQVPLNIRPVMESRPQMMRG